VFRTRNGPEILLLHPGGPFWAKSDKGAWSIFKTNADPDDPLAGARRDFIKDTALSVDGDFTPLEPVAQKNGKRVQAFAVDADLDLANFRSNEFALEWPLGSGQRKTFPEVDRIAYFELRTALRKILPYQWPLLLELSEKMGWHIPRARSGVKLKST